MISLFTELIKELQTNNGLLTYHKNKVKNIQFKRAIDKYIHDNNKLFKFQGINY